MALFLADPPTLELQPSPSLASLPLKTILTATHPAPTTIELVFPGSFNPPHLGHISMLQHAHAALQNAAQSGVLAKILSDNHDGKAEEQQTQSDEVELWPYVYAAPHPEVDLRAKYARKHADEQMTDGESVAASPSAVGTYLVLSTGTRLSLLGSDTRTPSFLETVSASVGSSAFAVELRTLKQAMAAKKRKLLVWGLYGASESMPWSVKPNGPLGTVLDGMIITDVGRKVSWMNGTETGPEQFAGYEQWKNYGDVEVDGKGWGVKGSKQVFATFATVGSNEKRPALSPTTEETAVAEADASGQRTEFTGQLVFITSTDDRSESYSSTMVRKQLLAGDGVPDWALSPQRLIMLEEVKAWMKKLKER